MIPYQNCEIIASVLFVFAIKIFCRTIEKYREMYKRQPTLTSIPERNENEEQIMSKKWVPKKKHEVLKAKYKCLKKLFQIYDASVLGMLPEQYPEVEAETNDRRKRSHRSKIDDRCPAIAELTSGDDTQMNSQNGSVATVIVRDLKMTQCSSTLINKSRVPKFDKYANTRSIDNLTVDKECECHEQSSPQHPIPYLIFNEKRRPTWLQIFMQRLFGIRRERAYRDYGLPNGHVYAASDNNISYSNIQRRHRRGFRFRKLRKPKKIQSDGALKNLKSPVILSYVQSVQRRCLTDRTPRQCPIKGCGMIFYGIINYNDHLNLCHFPHRKYVCHYCHEGFESEYGKIYHENEHIGISRLCKNINALSPSRDLSAMKASNTQTDPELNKCDVPEEKLKKILSFFDKFGDSGMKMMNIRHSETPLSKSEVTETGDSTADTDKRTVSCVNLHRKVGRFSNSTDSEVTSKSPCETGVKCSFCGENFDYRRQLSLHVDLEHRVHDKFSKFHSCAGIVNQRQPKRIDMISEDGTINVTSVDRSNSVHTRADTASSHTESMSRIHSEDGSLTCDESTNITLYTSIDSLKKSSSLGKSGLRYKWEPGNSTQVIRV